MNKILITATLGYASVISFLTAAHIYKALYTGNRDGVHCIDFNSIGEGNLELFICGIMTFILITAYFKSLRR